MWNSGMLFISSVYQAYIRTLPLGTWVIPLMFCSCSENNKISPLNQHAQFLQLDWWRVVGQVHLLEGMDGPHESGVAMFIPFVIWALQSHHVPGLDVYVPGSLGTHTWGESVTFEIILADVTLTWVESFRRCQEVGLSPLQFGSKPFFLKTCPGCSSILTSLEVKMEPLERWIWRAPPQKKCLTLHNRNEMWWPFVIVYPPVIPTDSGDSELWYKGRRLTMNKEYHVHGTIVVLRKITTSQFHLRSAVILAEPTNAVMQCTVWHALQPHRYFAVPTKLSWSGLLTKEKNSQCFVLHLSKTKQ